MGMIYAYRTLETVVFRIRNDYLKFAPINPQQLTLNVHVRVFFLKRMFIYKSTHLSSVASAEFIQQKMKGKMHLVFSDCSSSLVLHNQMSQVSLI